MFKSLKRNFRLFALIIVGLGSLSILIIGIIFSFIDIDNTILLDVGISSFVTVFLVIFLNFGLIEPLKKKRELKWNIEDDTRTKKEELKMELFKIKWYLEKGELKTAIHNKVFLFFSYLSENLPELERMLDIKIINNLEELFKLTKYHQEIGYKNPEGVWVSRRFIAESDLEQYINYRRELIEKGDFSESDYSHYDTKTCISKAKEDIHRAEEEIERRKTIVDTVQSITHLCNLTIAELEPFK